MLWLEHISPEQLQMGIAVCSLLTVLLLIVTLHKINRIQRYIQKKQTGTDRMESAEFGSAFPAEGVSQCEAAAEGAKKYPADMLIDEVIEEVFSLENLHKTKNWQNAQKTAGSLVKRGFRLPLSIEKQRHKAV